MQKNFWPCARPFRRTANSHTMSSTRWLNGSTSIEKRLSNGPGNLLVAPLQNAWADGKITKTEARQLARVILQICKEAAKREKADSQAVEIASEAARRFDLTRPELPVILFSTRVRSQTKRSDFYEVELKGPTCTCPDFRSFRHRLRERHLTRCCKHILDAYAQLKPSGGWPGWLGAFLALSWTPHPRQNWQVLSIGQGWLTFRRPELVLISSAPNGWANVFAPYDGYYDSYGYNVIEDRWAYGIEPPASERIKKGILSFQKGSARKSEFVLKVDWQRHVTAATRLLKRSPRSSASIVLRPITAYSSV